MTSILIFLIFLFCLASAAPKIFIKKTCNGLVCFGYEHGSFCGCVAMWKSHADGRNGFGNFQDFIYADIDIFSFENAFQFLVYLVCCKTYADMRLNAFFGKMEHRSQFKPSFGDAKGTFHIP